MIPVITKVLWQSTKWQIIDSEEVMERQLGIIQSIWQCLYQDGNWSTSLLLCDVYNEEKRLYFGQMDVFFEIFWWYQTGDNKFSSHTHRKMVVFVSAAFFVGNQILQWDDTISRWTWIWSVPWTVAMTGGDSRDRENRVKTLSGKESTTNRQW